MYLTHNKDEKNLNDIPFSCKTRKKVNTQYFYKDVLKQFSHA